MAGIQKVDHVALALPSIADAIPLFCEVLGGQFLSGGDNDEAGIRLVHLLLPGFKLELMQPLRPDSFLQRHLDERGPGFHHMTFFVDDLRSTMTTLAGAGFATTGADFSAQAWKEVFLSPRSSFGTLLQFVETTRKWDEPHLGLSLNDVLEGRVVWREFVPCLRDHVAPAQNLENHVQTVSEVIHSVDDRTGNQEFVPPEALLRSRRQGEILGAILTNPEAEFPLSALARRLGIPYSSVHREIERAERYGIVTSRRFENLRLVRAKTDSPYFASLAGLLRTAQAKPTDPDATGLE